MPYDPTIYLGSADHYRYGRVAETVYDMLEPGGALALIVHTVTGRPGNTEVVMARKPG